MHEHMYVVPRTMITLEITNLRVQKCYTTNSVLLLRFCFQFDSSRDDFGVKTIIAWMDHGRLESKSERRGWGGGRL